VCHLIQEAIFVKAFFGQCKKHITCPVLKHINCPVRSYLLEVTDETDGVSTGDPEDAI
jgi:hypothetical protein